MSARDVSTLARRRFHTSGRVTLKEALFSRSQLFIKKQYDVCISAFSKALSVATSGFEFQGSRDDLEEIRDNLIFWGDEYGASNGSLDRALEKSKSLRGYVLETMFDLQHFLTLVTDSIDQITRAKERPEEPQSDQWKQSPKPSQRSQGGEGPNESPKTLPKLADLNDANANDGEINMDADGAEDTDAGIPGDEEKLSRSFLGLNQLVNGLYDLAPSLISPAPLDDINQPTLSFSLESEIRNVRVEYPNASRDLIERLGAANFLRRNRLFAWKTEYEMLTKGTKYMDANLERSDSSSESSDGDEEFLGPETYANLPWDWIRSRVTRRIDDDASSAMSMDYLRRNRAIGDPDDNCWKTVSSFECQYCFQLLTKVHKKSEWHRHVLEDLESYVCTFGGCSQSFRSFRLRKDWWNHEMQSHRKENLSNECLLCLESVDPNHLSRHIAGHLEHLATSALPAQGGGDWSQTDKTRPASGKVPGVISELQGATSYMNPGDMTKLPSATDSTLSNQLRMEAASGYTDDPESDTRTTPDSIIDGVDTKPLAPEWMNRHYEYPSQIPFRFIKALGAGSCAMVDEVEEIGSGRILARKSFRKLPLKKLSTIEVVVKHEVAILQKLNHHHIIKALGIYSSRRALHILVLPVADFDLAYVLESWPDPSHAVFTTSIILSWFGCLTSGLKHLHERKTTHKDVKPSNILIKGSNILYSGFGISKDFEGDTNSASTGPTALTPRYAAPEAANYERRSRSSDIFSLGCVFLEMMTVVYGRKMEELMGFMRDDGYSIAYHKRLDRTMAWLNKLNYLATGRPTSVAVSNQLQLRQMVRLTILMLDPKPKSRISACVLLGKMRNLLATESGSSPFIGECCRNPEDGHVCEPNESDFETSHCIGIDAPVRDGPEVSPSLAAMRSGWRQQSKISTNAIDEDGQTPLWLATDNRHEAVVKLLLNSGKVDINPEDNSNQTLLWAAENGYEAIVKLLLDSGKVDVDLKDSYGGRTPLSWAAKNGHEAIAKLLLDSGEVDINSKDSNGQTPLSWAARGGHETVVKLLLDSGKVDVNSKDSYGGRTPLLWAAENGHETVVKLLLDSGKVDVNSKDSYNGQTTLSWAAKNGHEAIAKLLLDSGEVDVNSKDSYGGRTPLLWAAENGHETVVKLLLNSGEVDVNSKDSYGGRTPLLWAAENGHEAVVKLLLDSGKVDVDLKDKRGQTSLSWAAEKGYETVVKLLLNSGKVDVDLKDKRGQTPLSWAAGGGHEAVVKLLLDSGEVDVNSKDSNGQTPLSWAARGRHETVVKLLLDSGKVDVNSKDSYNGQTTLSWAAKNGHEAIAKLLLDSGEVDVNSKDSNGQTPWAARGGHETVVKLLLDSGKVDVNSKDSYNGQTTLSWAAKNGHEAIAKLLLDSGEVDVNSKDSNGQTPLSWAARGGHETVVKLLLDSGKVDVNSKDSYGGRTPLLWAAENGHETVVKLLLDSGKVDVNSKDSYGGRTPLLWAAENGHEAVVKLLLDSGKVDVNSKDSYGGRTPLLWAAENGHEAVVKLLLDSGKVDINSKDSYNGQTILSWAAKNGHEAIAKLLLDSGEVDVNSKDSNGQTPLSWAARGGHEAVVKLLLDSGKVDVNSKDSYGGRTPLLWAAENGHETVVKLLLDSGKVDVNSKDSNGQTPLSWAARGGHETVVKLLLDSGKVDVNSKDSNGQTPLSWAARDGHETVVKLLLESGKVDVDLKNKYGQTPLSLAVTNRYEAVVKLLLDSGKVDVDLKDKRGQTPLSWAAGGGHEAVVKLLLDSGKVDVNSKDSHYDGQTPLSWAARNGHEAIAKLLLNSGKVDINSKDNCGQTPLSWATKNGHKAIVKLLQSSTSE
ncbi:MAG: hypothetical protein M1840_004643 [Geoglossum simile]|nr:MAG: hypothetical protein M1840_004643 [Geoglossum simile]